MEKISVALITKNEAETVGRCLKSLEWADEIVVLDGYSTDKTVEICREYTDKIFQKKFESFPAEREYILKKTSNKWVLSVDSDMYFPPEFREEINGIFSKPEIKYDAFLMRGLTLFLGRWIRHCSWFDWRFLRLFNKEKGYYDLTTKAIDPFIVKGSVGRLRSYFIHYGGDSFNDYFGKIKRYSYLGALEYKEKGVKLTSLNLALYLVIKPFVIFLYKYFLRFGFMDGIPGFFVCANSAVSYYVIYATLWDMQRKEVDQPAGGKGQATGDR
jgi:glycosyltransferase involved in cell wall biosynthesis